MTATIFPDCSRQDLVKVGLDSHGRTRRTLYCCRPWRTSQLNMSTPSSMSMYRGTLNSGQARSKPDRCLQLVSNDTGIAGNLVVIWGRTAACTFNRGLESLPIFNDLGFVTVRVTTDLEDSKCSGPPKRMTHTCWHCWDNCSRRAKRSVMNDMDDAQSSNAHAFVMWPSDVTTAIWQVIMSTLMLASRLQTGQMEAVTCRRLLHFSRQWFASHLNQMS